jgi:HPt (histidine-containing phosphotransfer) domain-containing protein
MNDYLSKPIDLKVLRATLAKWAPRPSRLADLPSFDAGAMHSRFGGDEELKEVALAAFRQSTPALLGRIRAVLDAGNRQQFGLLAHSARGAGAMVAAERYAAIAAVMEDHAGTASEEELRRLVDELRTAFYQFLAVAGAAS